MIGIAELVIILLLLAGIPWHIALIDILRSDFTGNDKLIWLLVIIFIPFIGPIVYFIVGRKQKIRTKKE
jgi:uncharacterized membrane protein